MVIIKGPVLHFTFGEQREESGTKYINSSSDPENSLPFSNSVLLRKKKMHIKIFYL